MGFNRDSLDRPIFLKADKSGIYKYYSFPIVLMFINEKEVNMFCAFTVSLSRRSPVRIFHVKISLFTPKKSQCFVICLIVKQLKVKYYEL